MKIANADKLKKHFENVVDVTLFTVPNILTIIDTFSSEVPEGENGTGIWARHDEWRGGEYIGGFYHVGCLASDGIYIKWPSKYCPNCGKKMDMSTPKEAEP